MIASRSLNPNFLHCLIANDALANSSSSLTVNSVRYKDSKFYNLTPLHIATLKVNLIAVQMLLIFAKTSLSKQEFNDYINAVDDNQWAACHFAAFVSEKIYVLLEDFGANMGIRNSLYATAEQLRTLSGKKLHKFSMAHTFLKTKDQVEKSFAELSSTELISIYLHEYKVYGSSLQKNH